jgi:hypothetical protein
MGLKDRLLRAKCKIGAHSGEWLQVAAGSCDEQRTCAHCGLVSSRTEHRLSGWSYVTDPAAPACTRERHCQRCPDMEREVKHTMRWRADYPGGHEKCMKRHDCTRCGFTEGRTMLAHQWQPDPGTGNFSPAGQVFGTDNNFPAGPVMSSYTCMNCLTRVTRYQNAPPPMPGDRI